MALTARTAALWEKEKRSREGDGPVSSWLAVVVVELECRQQVSGVFRVFTSLLNASRWNEGQSKGRLVPFVVTLVQENVYKSPLSLSFSFPRPVVTRSFKSSAPHSVFYTRLLNSLYLSDQQGELSGGRECREGRGYRD